MIRDSAVATIQGYLQMAQERLDLQRLDKADLEKALEHIEKAEEEIKKELDE